VRWLAQHIAEPDSNSSSQQMRLESDKHLVQIVTIHKSKGLEYPLVWLPFIAVSFRIRRFITIATSFAPVLDLSKAEESIELAEAERLAEDLRLLYVALTRGLALQSGNCPYFAVAAKNRRQRFSSQRAGRLIQQGNLDAAGLACVEALCNDNIALHMPDVPDMFAGRRRRRGAAVNSPPDDANHTR
jgi:exodeoxyribonuclease V beta subunit